MDTTGIDLCWDENRQLQNNSVTLKAWMEARGKRSAVTLEAGLSIIKGVDVHDCPPAVLSYWPYGHTQPATTKKQRDIAGYTDKQRNKARTAT